VGSVRPGGHRAKVLGPAPGVSDGPCSSCINEEPDVLHTRHDMCHSVGPFPCALHGRSPSKRRQACLERIEEACDGKLHITQTKA
jgi:hypothetical protein